VQSLQQDRALETNCWGNPGNEGKRPQWLKKKEQASAAIGRSTAPELLLCGLAFLTSQKILEHVNMWIGDTAATTHSNPHTQGLYDMKEPTAKYSITMAMARARVPVALESSLALSAPSMGTSS
jgi:hypothetical protein